MVGEPPKTGSDGKPLPDPRLDEFREAWKEEFGEEISEGDARIRLHELVEFYLLVAKPLPKKNDIEEKA